MKRTFLFLSLAFLFLFPIRTFSQINWVNDMTVAKALAMGQNKMILIDFWATWCGPCRKMEDDFWNTDKVNAIKDKVIFLKIDIDNNRNLASKFGVRGIPYVVLADIAGNKVWDVVGYQDGKSILKVLKNTPKDVKAINNAVIPLLQHKETDVDLLNIGKSYTEVAKDIKNRKLRKKFFYYSNHYFKKIKQKVLKDEVKLRILLNKAYMGGGKKLLKKIHKIPETATNKELREFILTYIQKHSK